MCFCNYLFIIVYIYLLQSVVSSSVVLSKGLLSVQDEDWKRIRHTITPTFSALKLKQVRLSWDCSLECLGESSRIWESVLRHCSANWDLKYMYMYM